MARKTMSALVFLLAVLLATVPAWGGPGDNPGPIGPNGPGDDCTPVGDGPFGPSSNGPIGSGGPHGPAPAPGFGFGFGHDDGSDPSPNGPNGPGDCDSGHL